MIASIARGRIISADSRCIAIREPTVSELRSSIHPTTAVGMTTSNARIDAQSPK